MTTTEQERDRLRQADATRDERIAQAEALTISLACLVSDVAFQLRRIREGAVSRTEGLHETDRAACAAKNQAVSLLSTLSQI